MTVEHLTHLFVAPALVESTYGPVWRGKPMGGSRRMRAEICAVLPDATWFEGSPWRRRWFHELFDEAVAVARHERDGVESWLALHPASRDARVGLWACGPAVEVRAAITAIESHTGWLAAGGFDPATLPSIARLRPGLPPRDVWLTWPRSAPT